MDEEVTTAATDADGGSPPGRSPAWLRLLKVAFVLVVLYAIGRHVQGLLGDWNAQERNGAPLSLAPVWFVASILAFLAGQLCFSTFWWRSLRRCGSTVSWTEATAVYLMGTAGKYVPGKAFVLALRTGMLAERSLSRFSVGLTVLYETATAVAAAVAVAAVCLILAGGQPSWLIAAMSAGAAALCVALHPKVFDHVSRFASMPFRQAHDPEIAPALASTLARWWPIPVAGWLLLGASFWAVVRSMGAGVSGLSDGLLLTGTAALATAAGFLVLVMPAGLGVREVVVIYLLAPRLGAAQAAVASLLLRTSWTVAEIGTAGLLYGIRILLRRTPALAPSERATGA